MEDEEEDVAGLAAPVDFRAIAFLVGVELFRPRRSGLVVSPLGGPPEAALLEELLDEEDILWQRWTSLIDLYVPNGRIESSQEIIFSFSFSWAALFGGGDPNRRGHQRKENTRKR